MYGQGDAPGRPFLEDAERLPVDNFAQEDEFFAAAALHGLTWERPPQPHRSRARRRQRHESASTLAAYAGVQRHLGHPFVCPGSRAQWDVVVAITDASLLADR